MRAPAWVLRATRSNPQPTSHEIASLRSQRRGNRVCEHLLGFACCAKQSLSLQTIEIASLTLANTRGAVRLLYCACKDGQSDLRAYAWSFVRCAKQSLSLQTIEIASLTLAKTRGGRRLLHSVRKDGQSDLRAHAWSFVRCAKQSLSLQTIEIASLTLAKTRGAVRLRHCVRCDGLFIVSPHNTY